MIVLYGIIVHQKNSNLLKNARIEADGIITALRKNSSRNVLCGMVPWLMKMNFSVIDDNFLIKLTAQFFKSTLYQDVEKILINIPMFVNVHFASYIIPKNTYSNALTPYLYHVVHI